VAVREREKYLKHWCGVPFLIALAHTLLIVGLSGCVTPGETLSEGATRASDWVRKVSGRESDEAAIELTPAEKRMREQSRAFQRTVWQGVLIGAGAGALWSVLRGGDARDALKGALIGGAVGGLAGLYIAHKQRQYANKEDQLDSMISDVRQSNKDTRKLIASVRKVVAEDRRRLASVKRRYRAGKASESELNAMRARVVSNQEVVEEAVDGAREKEQMFRGAEQEYRKQNPTSSTGQLKREIDAYNKQIGTLDKLADSISVA
jgi:gas vesicle protein